ncbi:transglutaminase domain protein [Cellulomonas flavigena DSM 20109]|uniref:Transglutaminase domain protein n=1 Tax=Cellulomonas flavigena (strain ATCC 482 / DSM 20109 / BCRC 11376 / JCM 18109 / NBRC 3775 / NCIMB 8073 / NRS 134) TaxID=446466 RepID=D5UDS4_CELFN|nr:transglutaminase domain-containing protein [Cellulomonas flavigena]ADG74482.1 transglutaminase domain protein [Cellulomonas flavigena DSM 20109]
MNAAPEQGARAVLGTLLCVLATWTSLLALTSVVDGRRWFVAACAAVLVVAASTALARAAVRHWWAPTVVGLVVALLGVVLRYGAPPGRPQFLPDLDAVGRAWATARQGATVISESFVPMPDVRPGEMLIVVGALAAYLLLDAVVLALRVPAVGGLPLLTLWIPGIVLGFPAGAAPVFWAAIGFLALLAYGAAPLHAHAGRLQRVATAAVAAVALAGAGVVAGPPLMGVPGWASVALPTFGDGPVGPLELSDDLDLRESLGSRSSQVVLRYRVTDPAAAEGDEDATSDDGGAPQGDAGTTADGRTPASSTASPTPSPTAPAPPVVDARLVGPLRAFTMATFDGRSWERTDADELEVWDPARLLTSDPLLRGSAPDAAAGTLAQVDLEVGALRERRLPVSTFPRTVAVDGAWGYDPLRDEVVGQRATGDGLTYSMLVQVPTLTKDDLRNTPVGTPPDAELYTTVPPTAHAEDIAALAAEVTADASTPYARAVDLQTWLRSVANFTYDTRVPPARSSDAVWDFLEDRRGYCVQFATAMAMMARTLDIPSRIGVGFLPGERAEDGSYVVTGRLAHAWPELYFDGLGWVRFEPTPATQTGPPPVWADPFTGITAPGSRPDEIGANPPAAAPTGVPTAPTTGSPGAADGQEASWAPAAVTVGLVLLAGGGVVTALLLVRRRRRRVSTPEAAWSALRRDLARVDVRWSDATSPRGVVRLVLAAVETRSGHELEGPPAQALDRLAHVVERARYAPTPAEHDAAMLDSWVREVRDGVRAALAQDAGRTPVTTSARTTVG